MKKFLFCLCIASTVLFAEEGCKTLYRGAAAYKAGDYASAVENWQDCIDNGFQSGDLFYNLGNAYFREGRLGLAILNYEKALRNLPTDDDVQYNLKLAQGMTKDKVEADDAEENPILSFFFRAHHLFSLKQQMIFVLGLSWILLILNPCRVLSGNPKVKIALTASVFPIAALLGAFACSASYKVYKENTHSIGVVIAETADVSSGPSDKDQTLNTLSEGTEVEVISVDNGWAHIKIGERINGFAKTGEVGIVK